jgi:peptide chain release factor 1
MPGLIAREQIDRWLSRHAELEQLMSERAAGEAYVKLAKEYAELAPVVVAAREVLKLDRAMQDLRELIEGADTEVEMRALAGEELSELACKAPELEQALRLLLLPKDANDEKSAILEIRAGTGGEEAALFAADLLRMYQRYAELRGWHIEIMSLSETDLDGIKEVVVLVKGPGAYARLKYESGVHRVQRVPETEAGGRIHTSAATVAVLPEVEEIDVKIEDKDLRVETYRSQGAGGQHVNTTDSAVRMTHLPTGIVVTCQDEKSQHKNRAKALTVLRARVYEAERSERDAQRAAERRSQVGSGDRSERVRTYNFPQGRVTDHRINLTLYKLDRVLSGEAVDEIIDPLIAEDQARKLADVDA